MYSWKCACVPVQEEGHHSLCVVDAGILVISQASDGRTKTQQYRYGQHFSLDFVAACAQDSRKAAPYVHFNAYVASPAAALETRRKQHSSPVAFSDAVLSDSLCSESGSGDALSYWPPMAQGSASKLTDAFDQSCVFFFRGWLRKRTTQ